MIVRPFEPNDIELLVLQPAQAYLRPMISGRGYGEALAQGEAWTGVDGDRVVACGGVVTLFGGGTGYAWAMISADIGHGLIVLMRVAERVLSAFPAQRIEASVDCNFEAGHRMAKSLGFEMEAPRMRKYTPDGRDAALYARVR